MPKYIRFLFIVFLLMTTSCGVDNPSLVVGGEAGPVNVGIAIDSTGQVSVKGGFAPKLDVKIGFVGLYMAIEDTIALTKSKPYTFFILWEDEAGEVHRKEYEIGSTFHVTFEQNELIEEIQGQNDCVIIVVRAQRKTHTVEALPPDVTDKEEPAPMPESHEDNQTIGSDPEQFMRDYFEIINNREYELSWSRLSENFHDNIYKRGGYQEAYIDWWNTVEKIEILDATIKSQNETEAEVFIIGRYYYKSGTITTSKGITYRLIKDPTMNTWLIDPN